MATIEFQPGDRFLYRSITQGYLVLWVRDDDGLWTASDEEQTSRGQATDGDIGLADGAWILARGDTLGELLATAIATALNPPPVEPARPDPISILPPTIIAGGQREGRP